MDVNDAVRLTPAPFVVEPSLSLASADAADATSAGPTLAAASAPPTASASPLDVSFVSSATSGPAATSATLSKRVTSSTECAHDPAAAATGQRASNTSPAIPAELLERTFSSLSSSSSSSGIGQRASSQHSQQQLEAEAKQKRLLLMLKPFLLLLVAMVVKASGLSSVRSPHFWFTFLNYLVIAQPVHAPSLRGRRISVYDVASKAAVSHRGTCWPRETKERENVCSPLVLLTICS